MTHANFPRNFRKLYPRAVRARGCVIAAQDGRTFLDAAGGAAVVNIGHGVLAVTRAMAEQAARLAYVHSSQFVTAEAEELAQGLLELAGENFRRGGRVFFTSGGSEATETALKLARQYFLESGQPRRYRVLGRAQSYHGSTLGALGVSGNVKRREPFAPMLAEWGKIPECFCFHCPLRLSFPSCELACAEELRAACARDEHQSISAFIFEPLSGATLGAAVPPPGYVQRLAEICRHRGILLIADEVMTGMGRTGWPLASVHEGIQPDLILLGKGMSSGYAPLGAVLVAARGARALELGSGAFPHGFTYNAHPVGMAAGLAVLRHIRAERLFERVAPAGALLFGALERLRRHPLVGDIRGRGLLAGIEFLRDAKSRQPFPPEQNVAARIAEAAFAAGVITYPVQGCVDGYRGDHLLLAPPFIISEAQIELLARVLDTVIGSFDPGAN